MKKIITSLLLVCGIHICTWAQTTHQYQRFLISAGSDVLSLVLPTPVIVTLEPAYRIHDDLHLSIKAECYFKYNSSYALYSSGKSLALHAQHYVFSSKFSGRIRPFVGFGVGIYKPASYQIALQSPQNIITKKVDFVDRNTVPGVCPRIGMEIDNLFIRLDYNWVSRSHTLSHSDTKLEYKGDKTSNNYLNLSVGFYLGGKRKLTD